MATQLQPITFISPAFMGLNKDYSGSLLGPEWATEARNAVFDRSGRLGARKGWADQTATPITGSPDLVQSHEFEKADGTVQMISATASALYTGTSAFTDISGTLTPSGGNWQFMNFNDKLIAVQEGETPIVYTGSGNFANITPATGSLPTGNAGIAAFGRLWIVDSDGVTIKYSGLLDETDWGGSGAGSIDMSAVWTDGTDHVVAIAAFGASLVVFGQRHIVMWVDGSGSERGLDPANMYVFDTIEGTGCIARDSVTTISEGDLLFLSSFGLQSLKRVMEHKNNPLIHSAPQVTEYMSLYTEAETVENIRAVYSPHERLYLLTFPASNLTMVFDTRNLSRSAELRVTEWDLVPNTMVARSNGDLFFGFDGRYGKYTGYSDNNSAYRFVYKSGWLDLRTVAGDAVTQILKILKALRLLVSSQAAGSVVLKWGFDFEPDQYSASVTLTAAGSAEWGVAEWGVDEWSGAEALRTLRVNASGTGQFIQLGVESDINGGLLSMQQLTAQAKLGRLV